MPKKWYSALVILVRILSLKGEKTNGLIPCTLYTKTLKNSKRHFYIEIFLLRCKYKKI